MKTWTQEEMDIMEKYFSIKTNDEMTELLPGKSYRSITVKANRMGLKKTPELRSLMQKGENNHFSGKKHTDKTKEHLKEVWDKRKTDPNWEHTWSGKKHSEETRKKLSSIATARLEDGTWHVPCPSGSVLSEELKQRLRKPHNMTEEGKETLRKSVMERRFKTHIDYTRRNGLIEHFDSSYEVRIATRCDELEYDWTRNHSKIRVKWIDENNSEHYYYPDFTIWFEGKEYIVEAKGEHLLDLDTTKRKLEAGKQLWGDKFLMVSEKDIENFESGEWF